MSDENTNDSVQQPSDDQSAQNDEANNCEVRLFASSFCRPEFEVRESYPDMSGTTDGVRFGVGRVLGTLLGVGLSLVLVAGLLILADNLTITLFSIEIGGWNIWAFCWLCFGTIACTKLGLSAFSEQGMPLSKKRRITGPSARCIGVIILSLNAAVIVGYLYVLFELFMEMKGGV